MCRSQAFVPQDSCSFSTRNRTGRDALPNKRGKRVRAGSEAVALLRATPAPRLPLLFHISTAFYAVTVYFRAIFSSTRENSCHLCG